MNSVDINHQLFQNLCDSVRKWFEKDRGYEITFSVTQSDCYRTYVFPKLVIGDTERDADLEVSITQWDDECRHYCWILCHLTFDHKIKVAEEGIEAEVLRFINSFNIKNPSRCIFYDTKFDHIAIHQEWNFYPGAQITDDEIAKLIDDFLLDKDVENIYEVIEVGGWRFPELYIDKSPIEIDLTK